MRRGYHLHVIDLSAGGALVEGRQPLRPGSYVDVHLESEARKQTLAARVVRCTVSAIDAETGITYRAALSFTNSCDWVREVLTPGGNGVHVATAGESERRDLGGEQLPTSSDNAWRSETESTK